MAYRDVGVICGEVNPFDAVHCSHFSGSIEEVLKGRTHANGTRVTPSHVHPDDWSSKVCRPHSVL